MNKKVSLGAALAMAFIAAAAAVAITMSASVKMYNSIISDLPGKQQLYSSVSEIDDIVRREYYGNIDNDLLDSEIFNGYVLGLNDKYSKYMTAPQYSEYKSRAKGKIAGIGLVCGWDSSKKQLKVLSSKKGSPAQIAGITKDAVIKKIDEVPVTSDNYEKLLKSFEGEMLATVKISYEQKGKTNIVSVVKGYESQAVTNEINGDTGIISIFDFYNNAALQLKSTLDELLSKGVTSLIIDLRSTSEGDIETAAKMADYFVPLATQNRGMMARAVNKAGDTVETFSSDTDEINIPVVLLINNKTEGASEFFTVTLKSFGKAQTVGNKTHGKCTLQKVFELSNGGAVTLTTANIIPYSGESYEGKGLLPDYEVSLAQQHEPNTAIALKDDLQMQKALSLLSDKNHNS
jgi:carboxyl-terminal processing protease